MNAHTKQFVIQRGKNTVHINRYWTNQTNLYNFLPWLVYSMDQSVQKTQKLLNEVSLQDTLHHLGFISKLRESTCARVSTCTHTNSPPLLCHCKLVNLEHGNTCNHPSPTWNAFIKALALQYLSNGKFVDAALQYPDMIKFISLHFYTALSYSTYQMAHD